MKKAIFAIVVILTMSAVSYSYSIPKNTIIGVEAAVTGRSVGDLIADWMGAPK